MPCPGFRCGDHPDRVALLIRRFRPPDRRFRRAGILDFIRAVAERNAPFYGFGTIAQRIGFQIVSLKDKPVKKARKERPERSKADTTSWEGVDKELFEALLAFQ